MERFEETVAVPAEPDVLWATLTDPQRVPRWLTVARDVAVDGDPGAGQRLTVTGSHLGMTRTIHAHVDVWEPVAAYGWAVTDPLTLRFRYQLTPQDEVTRLAARVDADLSGLPRMATRLAVRSLRREFARSIATLRALAAG